MGTKGRFIPSDKLGLMLLELAGIDDQSSTISDNGNYVPEFELDAIEPESTVDSLDFEKVCKDARQLKHQADRTSGPTKLVLYVRSGLRFLQMFLALQDVSIDKKIHHLGSTADLLEFASKKCFIEVRAAIDTKDCKRLEDYSHLAVLGFRLSAVARMQRFYHKTEKLRRYWDVCKQFEIKKSSPEGQFISEYDKDLNNDYSAFIVDQAEDSLIAMEHWNNAEKILSDVEVSMKHFDDNIDVESNGRKHHKSPIELLPTLAVLVSHDDLARLLHNIRKALDQIYSV